MFLKAFPLPLGYTQLNYIIITIKLAKLILLSFFFAFYATAQSLLDLGKFPSELNAEKPLSTTELLKALNWESLKEYGKKNKGHYTYTRKDSLITRYEYTQQGGVAEFRVASFDGMVLEFYSQISNTSNPTKTEYFDKSVWMKYVNTMLPNLPDSLQLSLEEPTELLKAYYRLLGVGRSDEYGWICEYSTVGMAPPARENIIELIGHNRIDLLKKLLHYPNVQIQVYAADALIYIDYRNKRNIAEANVEQERLRVELDSLQKADSVSKWMIESVEYGIKSQNDLIKYLESELLEKTAWEFIYRLRDSNQIVKTCGNMGSYKIYEGRTSELLSEKAIIEIPKEYESLKESGYFR